MKTSRFLIKGLMLLGGGVLAIAVLFMLFVKAYMPDEAEFYLYLLVTEIIYATCILAPLLRAIRLAKEPTAKVPPLGSLANCIMLYGILAISSLFVGLMLSYNGVTFPTGIQIAVQALLLGVLVKSLCSGATLRQRRASEEDAEAGVSAGGRAMREVMRHAMSGLRSRAERLRVPDSELVDTLRRLDGESRFYRVSRDEASMALDSEIARQCDSLSDLMLNYPRNRRQISEMMSRLSATAESRRLL